MIKKIFAVLAIVSVLLLTGFTYKVIMSPKVIATYPQNGAQNVDTTLKEIWVKFDKTMMDKSWSWSYDDKTKFPQLSGKPYYADSTTKCILPVKLQSGKEYVIWINTQNNKGFKDKDGTPAEPYKFTFKTK